MACLYFHVFVSCLCIDLQCTHLVSVSKNAGKAFAIAAGATNSNSKEGFNSSLNKFIVNIINILLL
jgi:hypothetical protein